MVSPVVQRLREPESDRSRTFVSVSLVNLSHHRAGVKRPRQELRPSRTVALHYDAKLRKRHVLLVDVECGVAGEDEQASAVAADEVADGFKDGSARAGDV